MGQFLARPTRQSTKQAHLLNLPPEMRNMILEDLLRIRDDGEAASRFHNGVLTNGPAVLRVCKQLRREAGPIFFATRRAAFRTFGELGVALLASSPTLEWWDSVHIDRAGRHEPVKDEGQKWHLEPGLAMLVHVPDIRHIVLAGIELRTSSELRQSSLRSRGPRVLPSLRIQNGVHLAGGSPSTELQTEEAKLSSKLNDIADQVLHELPRSHPKLQSVEIAGLLREESSWLRGRGAIGRFRAVWKFDTARAEWLRAEVVIEPVEGRSVVAVRENGSRS